MKDTIWEREEYKPYAEAWEARQRELARRESYYDGSVYTRALSGLAWLRPRAGAEIRPLYLPLARAVNVDAGVIPGEWRVAKGAERFRSAIETIFRWSGWEQDGVLYVHYGSLYGCAGLRVADLQAERKVMLAPVNPRTFMLVGRGLYDRTPEAAIVVEQRPAADGEPFEYAEVITRDQVRTYANGSPSAFDGRPASYPNALALVPFVEVKHVNTGRALGDCAFEKVIPLLDQVNRLASELADVIHRHRDPVYVIKGAESSQLVRGGENVWFLPEAADVKILLADLDIPGVLEFIRESRAQVEAGLVQLSFDQVTGRKQALAAETVKLQLLELVLYVRRTRPNYDRGLVEALRMAGHAAQLMSRGRDDALAAVAALDSDELALDNERPVLPLAALGLSYEPDLRARRAAGETKGGVNGE